MTSPDFPGGSHENPAIIPDTDDPPSDGSPDNPAMIIESDDEAPPPPPPPIMSNDDLEIKKIYRTAELINARLTPSEIEKQLQLDEDGKILGDDKPPPPPPSPLDVLCHVASDILQEQEKLRKKRQMEEWWRVWEAERAESIKKHVYEVAKQYARDLHSDKSPNLFQEQSKDDEDSEEEGDKGTEKSPFLDAKKAIKKRRRDLISTTTGIDLTVATTQRKAPTLTELSMRALAQYSDAIKSLYLVPDHLKKKLTDMVSDSSNLDKRFMELLIQHSPSEVAARNCVEIEEEDLPHLLSDCDRVSLEALKLDLCGRAMTEHAMTDFLKRSPNGFPSLTRLSLQGAFSLTDKALALISKSAPLLKHINLSDCSLLTFQAVKILADNFGSTLRGLFIGGCQGIKPSNVFGSSLSKFKKLSYLSVAGLEGIHDVLAELFTSRGCNLTDLSLASCKGLNDRTIWILGRYCPNLEALDISEMDDLTDASLKEITDGCRYLRSVKLTRNRFSDLAVAAFLEVCGGSLNQLCLNNVRDVGQYTAMLLAQNCKRLHYLDLSWCRKLTEEQLRRILCCCSLLRSLKLFGWTQVKDEFLEELSRSQVNIVGLKMSSVFAHPDDSYPSVDAKFF